MALTVTEQLSIVLNGFPNLTQPLHDVVLQQGLNTAQAFIEAEKDTTGDTWATNYLEKMKGVFGQVQTGGGGVTNRLTQLIIAKVGVTTAGDYMTVINADEPTILTYLENNMLAVIEGVAQVTVAEKNAYANL